MRRGALMAQGRPRRSYMSMVSVKGMGGACGVRTTDACRTDPRAIYNLIDVVSTIVMGVRLLPLPAIGDPRLAESFGSTF